MLQQFDEVEQLPPGKHHHHSIQHLSYQHGIILGPQVAGIIPITLNPRVNLQVYPHHEDYLKQHDHCQVKSGTGTEMWERDMTDDGGGM